MKKSSPPANPKLERKINQRTLNAMLSLPIGCMKEPFFLLNSSSRFRPPSLFSSLVVCHHRILFLDNLFEIKTKRHKGRII
jgi:hypothetical protein